MRRAAPVVVLLLVALLLVGPLSDERRLASADERLSTDPAAALREASESRGPSTRARVTGTVISALAALGDLRRAETVAAAEVRAHPDDPFALRRLYQVQLLGSRDAAARKTLGVLRRVDPKFADGTGS